MGKRGPTKKELELKYRILRRARTSEGIYSTISSFLKWGFLGFVVWNFRIGLETLAGKETIGNITLSLISDFKFNEWVAYVVAFGGTGYGFAQRRLRKNTVERIQTRNEKLEKAIDPRRSSSRLTPRGDTRKEDQ